MFNQRTGTQAESPEVTRRGQELSPRAGPARCEPELGGPVDSERGGHLSRPLHKDSLSGQDLA